MNSVSSLILKQFSLRRDEDKLIVKDLGRPISLLNLTQEIT